VVAEHDPADELTENGGLARAHGEVAAELGRDEDDRQRERDGRDRIVVRCLCLRPRKARSETESDQERLHHDGLARRDLISQVGAGIDDLRITIPANAGLSGVSA
jgi:hypothetical protein